MMAPATESPNISPLETGLYETALAFQVSSDELVIYSPSAQQFVTIAW